MFGFGNILADYLEYYKISQSEFAERLDITQKHLNEIINGKTNISLELMIAISLITDIDLDLIVSAEEKKKAYDYLYSKYKTDKEVKQYLNSFNINELSKNNWIKLKNKDDLTQVYLDFKDYVGISNINNYDKFLNAQYSFKKNDPNINMKTFLFITHCNHLIKDIKVGKYDSSKLNDLFEELKEERIKPFNKERLINIFNKYGIILIIEEPLSGTKLRGCSRVKINTPVIYLTTMYKNKPSLYFTLYHEIGHIKRDYNALKAKTYEIDDEEKIDNYALDKMIDNNTWEYLKNKPSDYKKILDDNKIPLSFYYSRLAYDGLVSYKSKEYQDNIEKINLIDK